MSNLEIAGILMILLLAFGAPLLDAANRFLRSRRR